MLNLEFESMHILSFILLFSPLKETLSEYTRPFSVLEIGAKEGDLALEIASSHPHAVVTVVERNIGIDKKRADLLLERLERENPSNVLLLNKSLTFSDLSHLSQVEHFDIVIAHNILDLIRIPNSFSKEDLLRALRALGDHLFLTSDHYYTKDPILLQENWFSKKTLPPLIRENGRSFHLNCFPFPPFYQAITRIPGISLITFQALRGAWPTKDWIREELLPFGEELSPFHLTLQGKSLYLYPNQEPKGLQFTLDTLQCTTRKELHTHLYPQ